MVVVHTWVHRYGREGHLSDEPLLSDDEDFEDEEKVIFERAAIYAA